MTRLPATYQPATHDIWITGAAAVTSLGDTLDATWDEMLAGRTAGRRVELFTPNCRPVRVPAAPIDNDLLKGIPLESSSERADRMALHVAREVMESARLSRQEIAPAAIVFGSSKPAIGAWFVRAVMGKPSAKGSPIVMGPLDDPHSRPTWDMLTPQRAAVLIADELGVHGAILSSVSACSTGLHSLIRAMQWLRDGCGPIAIAGSVESSINPLFAAAFLRMRVLAATWPNPQTACRPFDRQRSGFIMGEGAAAMVLETPDHARARGAIPLAILRGYAMGADPTGLADLDPAGRPLASTMRRCLRMAGVVPEQVACVKAHGTATVQNDVAEAAAVAAVFGERAVPVVSLKGYLGHTLGASGAIEATVCVRAAQAGVIPGNANLTEPDPACGPNHPDKPTPVVDGAANHMLCLSAGFGGHLAAVLIRPA
jgi:3-oxoacyl-[acyl-carrier-protein] synthase II